MYGPKIYAELSSVAKDFLAREIKIQKAKVIPPYEYLGAGANISAKSSDEVDDIHKYLSPCALKKDVINEFGDADSFGKIIDIVG